MPNDPHLTDIQRYFASVAITPSALRNLGASGVVAAARGFLAKVDLTQLRSSEPSGSSKWLDEQTTALMQQFPEACRTYWGPAMKAINIFMTMAAMSRHLNAAYRLERFESVMETPLDGIAEKALRTWAKKRDLFSEREFPEWKSIKALDQSNSEKYQRIALDLAENRGVPRGRLDIVLWRPQSE